MKTKGLFAIILAIGGSISAFTWVPGAWASLTVAMNVPAVEAINDLSERHIKDIRILYVEMGTTLHRSLEHSDIKQRIHDWKMEIIRLERELREAVTQDKKESILRVIERLERDIDRELDEQLTLRGLTKSQIASYIKLEG